MTWLWRCEGGCGRARALLINIDNVRLCNVCWRKRGYPRPSPAPPTPAAELKIQQLMLTRGGADAHRVRAGKA